VVDRRGFPRQEDRALTSPPRLDRRAALDAMFAPHAVAVIGASERPGSVGRSLFENVIRGGFAGAVYPVTPSHESVFGVRAYASIADVPDAVDLAIVAVPAASAPDVVGQCAAAQVRGAIVISAGFRETGPDGAALERDLAVRARAAGMRVIGPNCLGVIVPRIGLNATFAAGKAVPGPIGFVSQSGALCTAILEWSGGTGIGFSRFISAGSMVDVGWGDYIDQLADDGDTGSILLYVESIGDPAEFVSAARAAATAKPVIVMKSGRTAAAAKAAASHTGALAGADDVLDAVLRRCGALRVETIEDLFDMADVLSRGRRPRGRRLAVVTNAGGPAVIAADALSMGGGELASLAPQTIAALDAMLPPHWSRANPVDLLGDSGPKTFADASRIVAGDDGADALLVIHAPTDIAPAAETAASIAAAAPTIEKALLAAWMGGEASDGARRTLESAGVAAFAYPEDAVRAFDYLWRYDDRLRLLYETPTLPSDEDRDVAAAASLLERARASGRTALNAQECRALLSAYRIPMISTQSAATPDEAVAAASRCGYPVAVKLGSTTLLHKTDVGGVALGIADEAGVRAAFERIRAAAIAHGGEGAFEGVLVQPMVAGDGEELIVGSTVDPQFGPVIAFGLGGRLVEVFRDSAVALPPLTETLAMRLMERTRIYRALLGVRGRPPADLGALSTLLIRFAALAVDHVAIKEMDLNPVFASADRVLALDARVILYDRSVALESVPHPVIRAYPGMYARRWRSSSAGEFDIRPVRPEDERLVADFARSLSDESVYLRFAHVVSLEMRTAHARLSRLCFPDYRREMTLVALSDGAVVGVGRLLRTRRQGIAEFALIVADGYQRRGLGAQMLGDLLSIARDEGYVEVDGYVLPENAGMLHLCRRAGFTVGEENAGQIRVVRSI
jgi:acetyltransferase